MIFPIKIPIELVELVKFVLPELIYIVVTSLVAIGIVVAIICMVVNIRKSKKLKDIYISFTKDEWDDYKSRYGKAFVEELMKSYDLYPKNSDPRKNLCGIWCNEDDSFRYYITDHNGYYSFMVENREVKYNRTLILRTVPATPSDKYVFFADGTDQTTLTIGYDRDEDALFIAESDSNLIRIEEYMRRRKSKPQPNMMEEAEISEIKSTE